MSRLLIDPDSKPVTLPKLNFFSTPGTVTEIEKTKIVKLKPIATLEGARELEFKYPGSDNEAVDISKTVLYMTVILYKKNGNAITDHISIAPCNALGYFIFKNFKMYLGDTLIDSSSDMYGHQNMLTMITNYSAEALKTHFSSTLWYSDDAGEFEPFNSTVDIKTPVRAASGTVGTADYLAAVTEDVYYARNEVNISHENRRIDSAKNREIEMMIPIQVPITNQNRCLPPRLPFRMVFTKADAETYLCAGSSVTASDYDIKITRAELWITKLQLENSKAQATELMWKTIPVKIPILREQMIYHTVDSGHKHVVIPNLRIGRLADGVQIFFMKSPNFIGGYTKHPSFYEHMYLESIDLRWNSESISGMPITMNYKTATYHQPWLLLSKPYFRKNRPIYITYYNFMRGYCVYNINLSNDTYSSTGTYYPVVRSGGILEAHFKFTDPTPGPIVIGFKFFLNNQININSDLSVTHDFDP